MSGGKPYEEPTVVEHGTIEDLTGLNGNDVDDEPLGAGTGPS